MRIAVISDIHGDFDSLRSVLTAIDRLATDQIWCLGDIVGLGATAPAEVVDLVRDRCALALAGNHDRWVTGLLSLSILPLPRQRAQLQWQHRVLSHEQHTWLAALPAQGRAHDIELWHGSAQDPITGWISSPQDAADHLARQQARIGLVGHTQRPLIAENNGTTIQYDEHQTATTSPTTVAQCSTPAPCSDHADGSNSTSQRETRSGTQPDLSVNSGAA